MGKLNRRRHHYKEIPSRTETSQTAEMLEMIKIVIRSTWNRKYMLEYIERESREMYMELKKYCKKHHGNSDRATMLKTLAGIREWLLEHPNSGLAHVFLFDIAQEK
jgi:hypothetical protein